MGHYNPIALVAVALLTLSPGAAAQAPSAAAHRRLQQSLDAATYRVVSVVIDSARARGIPVAPLVNRALQGTLHRIPGPVIRDAVFMLAERLKVAKASLGPSSSDAEIAAGANALAGGVPRAILTEIRALSAGRSLTVPLGVLTELVARDVAVGRASQMVVALLRNGATPAQLVSLNENVRHDVGAGIAATAALDIRTRGVLGTLLQSPLEAERAMVRITGTGDGTAPRVPRKP